MQSGVMDMITKFIISIFKGLPEMFRTHKVGATIYGILLMIIFIIVSVIAYKHLTKESKPGTLRNVLIAAFMIINFFRFIVLFMFGFASEYAKIDSRFLTKGFFKEMGILCILIMLYFIKKINKLNADNKDVDDESLEEYQEAVGRVIKAILVIIFSLIFIYTNLENSLRGYGFSLFGKKLGEWLYNFYCTASVEFILGFVGFIVGTIFNAFVGSSTKQLEQA